MKATEAMEVISNNRNEIVSLFLMIREARNGKLSREALVKYVMLRVKMKSLFDEYEKVRQEISEQTKPDDWQEGDSSERWDKAFQTRDGVALRLSRNHTKEGYPRGLCRLHP